MLASEPIGVLAPLLGLVLDARAHLSRSVRAQVTAGGLSEYESDVRVLLCACSLSALCALAASAGGCAAHRPAHARAAPEDDEDEGSTRGPMRSRPPHDAYDVLARTRVRFEEHELATLRTRAGLYVDSSMRHGLTLRARVFREAEGDGAFSDVEARLDEHGRLVADPLVVCDSLEGAGPSPSRLVRQILGTLAPWDGARRGRIATELSSAAADASFSYRAGEAGVVARASTSLRLGNFEVAGWRVRANEDALARIEEELDANDALVQRSRLVIETFATVLDRHARARDGMLEIQTDVIVRPASAETIPRRCE